MKKWITLALTLLLVFGAAACHYGELPEPPDAARLQADAEAFVHEAIDATAELRDFTVLESAVTDDAFQAQCALSYSGENAEGSGTFVLVYVPDGGRWLLKECRPEREQETGNEPSAGPQKVSDALEEYTFELDGVVYQLPCDYSALTAAGWAIEEDSFTGIDADTPVQAGSFEYVTLIKDGNAVTAYFINLSGNAKALHSCRVGGIELMAQELTSTRIFSVAQGIGLSSSREDVEEAFGEPDALEQREDNVTLIYSGDGDNIYTSFRIYESAEDAKYNTISLRSFVPDESDATETSDKVPTYLADYEAPEALGSDVMSGNIEIDGDLYCLPFPVSVLLDNGWEAQSPPNAIGAGATESIAFERAGKRLTFHVKNYESYQTIPENCAVYQVTVYESSGMSVRLPNGVVMGGSRAALESALRSLEISDGSSS